ncbi:MAG: ADP-ribosylglycohydrolase family protein [Cellulomonadaceae bacterium]|jgi:ADP-ribosylglycohydrolase|nr:ADP-ribosylglycohydrolase family protein [Cellulomonadaceae bacterium]
MELSPDQLDRARGALLGAAVGDALGTGYEFESAPFTGQAEMIGGGLGNFAPGEWSDDTAQTYAVAAAAAKHHELRSPEALDSVALGIGKWFADDPPDVGNITRAVLIEAGPQPSAAHLKGVARYYYVRHDRSAGNGSLMRTAPVALAHLDDPWALVQAAMAISYLTHGDPLAAEACAIWSLGIRSSVLLGGMEPLDTFVRYLPTEAAQTRWAQFLRAAETDPPAVFTPNGWVVSALQAALSSIRHTPIPPWKPKDHFAEALNTAISVGNDTDTVGSIAGAALGAQWGADAIPQKWREMVHGWPNATGEDLVALADRIVGAA